MSRKGYDFGGWATRNDIRCSDGRTIRHGAFKECDGAVVPIVWNHDHNSTNNVLGHGLLENRNEGVYIYGSFNETEAGRNAKEMVKHGDVTSLSIYANQLTQRGGDVLHGAIREVSLVLAGANPGAFIDAVMVHGEMSEEEAYIFNDWAESGVKLEIYHSDDSERRNDVKTYNNDETVQEVYDTFTDKQKKCVELMAGLAIAKKSGEKLPTSSSKGNYEDDGETLGDIFNTLNEKQKIAAYAIIDKAIEMDEEDEEEDDYDDEEDDEDNYEEDEESKGGTMKHNIFDEEGRNDMDYISHSDMMSTIEDAKRFGSLKESALQHGIAGITTLFPDEHPTTSAPGFINLNGGSWVAKVMSEVHSSPFSRLKSIYADISEDDARALGFLPDRTHRDSKGNLVDALGNFVKKKDEVFTLLKRTTSPATIYKKQKLDRDDIIDITDFDVVAWIKSEMRVKLDEEISRAILIGDGRLTSSEDKINESNIRPIWTDDTLYTINQRIVVASDATISDKAEAMIDNAVLGRVNYKGAGNPTLFTTETWLANMLLLKDLNGHRIYKTEMELATAMRVKEIVTVPYFENKTRTVTYNDTTETRTLGGIIVNLADYTVGADRGGAVNLFDDFDIDYNAQKYLIETRCSGSLLVPYSAIALEFVVGA